MLDFVRKHAKSWIIKIALLFIVVVFVFWGGYTYQSRQKSHIVQVGDVYITLEDYNLAYDRMVEEYRRQMGKNFSEKALKDLNLKQKTLDALIERIVLLQKAKDLGLVASSEEVREAISSIPAFQAKGVFDSSLYRLVLQQNRVTPEEFEQEMFQILTLQKLENFIKRQAVTEDSEIAEYVKHLKTENEFSFVVISPNDFVGEIPLVDDNTLRDYFKNHADRYVEPEKRRIAYLRFTVTNFTKDVTVTEDELKAYYNDHYQDYHEKKMVRARHILFQVPMDASEEEIENIKTKAENVLAQAKSGKDFAELARTYSEGPTAQNGGDLGFFSKDEMIPQFANVAFSLAPGQISDLVRTQYGFHIIKMEDVKPEHQKEFDEVKEDIRLKLITEKARDRAFVVARDFADVAFAARSVIEAAKEKGFSPADVWIEKGQPMPHADIKQLYGAEVANKFFEIEEQGISNVLEVEDGFIVGQVLEIQPQRHLSFDEAKEKVEEDFLKDEADRRARERAEEILKQARKEGSLEAIAEKLGLQVRTSNPVSRIKPDLSLGVVGKDIENLMALSKNNPFPEKPFLTFSGYVVCQWKNTIEPTPDDISKDVSQLRNFIRAGMADIYWQGWKELQKSQTDIKILQNI